MMVPTSASVIPRTKEIAIRRKCMSRAAKLVLNSSIYQLVMHTCFAELVRLPSPQDLPCSALVMHSDFPVQFLALYMETLEYLVNAN